MSRVSLRVLLTVGTIGTVPWYFYETLSVEKLRTPSSFFVKDEVVINFNLLMTRLLMNSRLLKHVEFALELDRTR